VSLIEQAAKRLEELRKSGADVPSAFVDEELGVLESPTTAPLKVAPAPRAFAPAEPIAPVHEAGRLADDGRASRSVRLDLERLERNGVVTPDSPGSQLASEFRLIKRPLLANAHAEARSRVRNANLVMVTSALAGEGKSFTAVNLAMSMAMELDTRVLLVDADVASPSVLNILGLPSSKGLMDALTDPTLDLASFMLSTNVEKLSILPAGTQHARATELLASDAMTRRVGDLAARYRDRIVVFDSPPLLLTTEAPVLATHVGQIVMVVEAERTNENTVKQALATIESCPIVLMLLNKAGASDIGRYYGYGYQYAPGQGPSKDRE
jgi:receptor protein-tyrosine kinase